MITIVDYGLGNILAFANVYKQLNIPVVVARQSGDLIGATRVILPGVGAFDHAMQLLAASGMRAALQELALVERLPILGVCVGMQILAESSEEGRLDGLGWIKGKVKRFASMELSRQTCVPHMGWNDVRPTVKGGLFENLEAGARFYFLHSYYFDCARADNILAVSEYGLQFSSAVRENNICGVQFHPEKSHHFGAQLLKNFAGM